MAVVIGSSAGSLSALRALNRTASESASVAEHLSSGLRITRASDDAASLSLAENLSTRSSVYHQGVRNINDAISATNLASDATATLKQLTTQMRELAERASNGAITARARVSLDDEFRALRSEYDRVVQSSSFNGRKLFDAANLTMSVQAGSGSDSIGIGFAAPGRVATGSMQAYSSFVSPTGIDNLPPRSFGDFNRDGTFEVLVTDSTQRLLLFRGNTDGTFKAGEYIAQLPANVYSANGVADLNNDGVLDISYWETTGANQQYIMLSNTDMTYKAPQALNLPQSTTLSFQDFNRDGIVDLYRGDLATNYVYVHEGNGDGTFKAPSSVATPWGGNPLFATDYNYDGYGDIGSIHTSGISIHMSNGDGTFRLSATFTWDTGGQVGLNDFNTDHIPDFWNTNAAGSELMIRYGTGNGSFSGVNTVQLGTSNLVGVFVSDFSQDETHDIMTIDNVGTLSYFRGVGDGSFTLVATSSVTAGVSFFTVADINGDSVADFVGESAGGRITTFLETTTISQTGNRALRLNPAYKISTAAEAKWTGVYLQGVANRISLVDAAIGAHKTRLEGAARNTFTQATLSDEAASRIMDADIAELTAKSLALDIRKQGASAVIANAAKQPSVVMMLLDDKRGT